MSATSTPKITHTTTSPPNTDATAVNVKKRSSEEEGRFSVGVEESSDVTSAGNKVAQ